MRSWVYLTVRLSSVHRSVPAGLLLWAQWAGGIDRLLRSQRSAAAAVECEQCHVVSVRSKLNTDLLLDCQHHRTPIPAEELFGTRFISLQL